MTSTTISKQASSYEKKRPEIRPGFTVRVHERIVEGDKERVQIFEGLVISVHKGHTTLDSTFTVRKLVSGIGVEKVFSLHSPKIENIEVKKVAKVRRAKLFFLRGLQGKAARLQERFTTAGEFLVEEDEVVEDEGAQDGATEEEAKTESSEEAKTQDAADDSKEEVKDEEASDKEAKNEEPSDEAKNNDEKDSADQAKADQDKEEEKKEA